jgi:hypothetical protein
MIGMRHDNQDKTEHMVTPEGPSVKTDGDPLFREALLATTQRQRHSHRTGAYTNKDDRMLCEAWLDIGQNPICGAEKKGGVFGRRIGWYFHEHRKFMSDDFESDPNDVPLKKRWSSIQ